MKDSTKATLALILVPAGWLALLFGASWAIADLQYPTRTHLLLKPWIIYISYFFGVICLGSSLLLAIKLHRRDPLVISAGLVSGISLAWIGWNVVAALAAL